MERPVSFDVTDYYPDGDAWSSDLGPSSPIHRNLEMKSFEDSSDYVIITLDVREDRVRVVGNIGSSEEGNPVPVLPKRNTSEALKGLKMFISMINDSGWMAVEKRFDKMTTKTDGLLLRSRFGACLGIKSKEFALKLFDALAPRLKITCEEIGISKLWDCWIYINDQPFGSRFRMFFDMADKDGDCRLTEEEVREFIRLTASANNQSITQETANEYAALIMEELDVYDHGYIIMEHLRLLLRDVEIFFEKENTEKQNPFSFLIHRLKK